MKPSWLCSSKHATGQIWTSSGMTWWSPRWNWNSSMNAAELNVQLLDAAEKLRNSLADLEERSKEYALRERQYRHAKAVAYLSTSGTVGEREARAEEAINEPRYQRDMAEGLKVSALEAVRSNRGVLSAVQTLANLYREEASFDRTGAA